MMPEDRRIDRAMSALDMQVRLIDSLSTTPGELVFRSFAEAVDEKQRTTIAPAFVASMQDALRRAETFTVDPEIVMELELAAEGEVNIECLSLDMLPSRFGFVRFERPLVSHERNGNLMHTIAIAWWVGTVLVAEDDATSLDDSAHFAPVIQYVLMTDPFDFEDEVSFKLLHTVGMDSYVRVHGGLNLAPEHIGILPLDDEAAQLLSGALPDDTVAALKMKGGFNHPASKATRALINFFRFSVAEILRDPIKPDRPTGRRAKRFLFGGVPEDLRIVRLRKLRYTTKEEHDEYEGIVRTHQWWRRGHWRRRFDSEGNTTTTSWVKGHWCGPDHLPAIMKDVVYTVDR